MENRTGKSFPGRVPSSDGESRTASSDAVWPTYTGGATNTMRGEEAAEAANVKEGAKTRSSPGPALLTAPEPGHQYQTRHKNKTTTDLDTTFLTPVVRGERMDDSDCSLYTMRTASSRESSHDRAGSVTGKRRLSNSGSGTDGGSEHSLRSKSTSRRKLTPAKRGRGRPPTTGAYVGYASAKQKYLALEREALQLQAEKDAAKLVLKEQRKSEDAAARQAAQEALDKLPPATKLKTVGEQGLELIKRVRTKSGNLNGTFVKYLKEGEAKVEESVRGLATLKEDTLKLEAENIRLKEELARLREKASQAQEVPLIPPMPTSAQKNTRAINGSEEVTIASLRAMFEDFSRSMMERTSNMINARIEAMEDRLLPAQRTRPPLAADRNNTDGTHQSQEWPGLPRVRPSSGTVSSAPATAARAVTAPTPTAPVPASEAGTSEEKKKGKQEKKSKEENRGKKKPAQQPPAPLTSAAPAPSTTEEGWNVVARRRRKQTTPDATHTDETRTQPKGPPKASKKPQSRNRPRRRRNAAPATTAVVITLQHDAVERGATYRDVLLKARQEIDLAELGLAEGVRIRQAATGARVMELPKNTTSDMADRFAEKLRAVLGGAARVTRPVKCADVRIDGLDDSVTKEAVLSAVVVKTGCSPDHVKGGEIREGPGGTGTMWVKCPVSAANSLVDSGRLLVGWSSARVQAIEPRSMKCFRCLELGHTGQRCTSDTDRSTLCHRCSQAGHKASMCMARPHCAVCAAAGKNAEHTIGGKGCAPPKKGRNRRRQPNSSMGRSLARQENSMETNNG